MLFNLCGWKGICRVLYLSAVGAARKALLHARHPMKVGGTSLGIAKYIKWATDSGKGISQSYQEANDHGDAFSSFCQHPTL